jgi:hypothetical protein
LRDPYDAACVPMTGCACSGKNIVVCECDDYTTEPLLHLGKCAVPSDAAVADAPAADAALIDAAVLDAEVPDAGPADAPAE